MHPQDKSCNCSSGARKKKRTALPVVLGLVVAILPKCPFCILAYSSAITLCSGAQINNHASGWTSWISIGLALLTLLLVLVNNRGRRTWAAAALVIAGGLLILRAELYSGNLSTYYLGAIFLLAGVWINASFLYFFRKWVQPAWQFLLSTAKIKR